MALSKEQILAANDLPTKTVNVPEWGGEVIVRTLTGEQGEEYELACMKSRTANPDENQRRVRERLCAFCIVGENGSRMFTEAEIDALSMKSKAALDRVFAAAQSLNRYGGRDLEDLAKN